jgi:hypothetical protein
MPTSYDILKNCIPIKYTNHIKNKLTTKLIKINYIEIGVTVLHSYKKIIQNKYSMLQHIAMDLVEFGSNK